MNFQAYWCNLDAKAKAALADGARTSVNHLSQVAHGHRNAGANLIQRLMEADSRITFAMMRPESSAAA